MFCTIRYPYYSVITDNLRPRLKCSVRRTGILLVYINFAKLLGGSFLFISKFYSTQQFVGAIV